MREQFSPLESDLTVLIKVGNPDPARVVQLDLGSVVALARARNPADVESDSPGFCLEFIRYYFLTEGLKDINLKGSFFCFGPNNDIKIDKDRRTNFRISGTPYSCGVQDYYTVEAVLYFLHQVENLDYPYNNYLRLVLGNGTQLVREKDYVPMFKYLHGEIGICPEIDKDFSEQQNKQLSYLFLKSMTMDSGLQLGNIRSQFKEEYKEEEKPDIDVTALIEPGDNPNRTVVAKLKEILLHDWGIKLPQVRVINTIPWGVCFLEKSHTPPPFLNRIHPLEVIYA